MQSELSLDTYDAGRRDFDHTAGFSDIDVAECLLSAVHRRTARTVAQNLLSHFGSLGAVFAARPAELEAVDGCKASTVAVLKSAGEAARRVALAGAKSEAVTLSSWQAVVDYARAAIGHESTERFLLLFLDRKNRLKHAEIQQRGTVDHTPVYPREVVKRALQIDASALVLVHNHPSGDPTPSRADIEMTRQIVAACEPLGVAVHDHIVISASSHLSFKAKGML